MANHQQTSGKEPSEADRNKDSQNYALQGVGSWASQDSSAQSNNASQIQQNDLRAGQAKQNAPTENPLDRYLNERPQDSGPVMLWLGSRGNNGGA